MSSQCRGHFIQEMLFVNICVDIPVKNNASSRDEEMLFQSARTVRENQSEVYCWVTSHMQEICPGHLNLWRVYDSDQNWKKSLYAGLFQKHVKAHRRIGYVCLGVFFKETCILWFLPRFFHPCNELHKFEGEVWVFLHIKPLMRIFMIMSDVLQHYYVKWCSLESWSSLLTSLLAENNGGACALRQSVKKYNKRLLLKTWNSVNV